MPPLTRPAGLCETCEHMSSIVSDRGSQFIRCNLAEVDPSFPKYPRLPVMQCTGYLCSAPKDQYS